MKIKRIFIATFLITITLTNPFTTIISSNTTSSMSKQKQEKLENTKKIDKNIILSVKQHFILFSNEKFDIKNNLDMLNIIINQLKLRFINHPIIVSLCQQIIITISLFKCLPDFICEILLLICFKLTRIADYVRELGFAILYDLLNTYAYTLYIIIELFCDIYPYDFKSLLNRVDIKKIIQKSNLNFCPCINIDDIQ